MSININTAYNLTRLIVNKNQGIWSVDRFNQAAQSANIDWFNDAYGQPVLQKSGQAVNDLNYQASEKASNNLRPFIKPIVMQINSQGQGIRPTDFVQTSSVRYVYGERQVEVKFVRDNNLAERLDSDLLAPSKSYPIYCIYDSFIQYYPKDLIRTNFTYLRMPATPLWAYTLVNNRPVYDAVNSVDCEFPQENLNEFVSRIVSLFGIDMREPMVQQFAAQQQAQGS